MLTAFISLHRIFTADVFHSLRSLHTTANLGKALVRLVTLD